MINFFISPTDGALDFTKKLHCNVPVEARDDRPNQTLSQDQGAIPIILPLNESVGNGVSLVPSAMPSTSNCEQQPTTVTRKRPNSETYVSS